MPLQDDVLNRTHCCSPVQVFLISVISDATALIFSCASGTLEITRFLVESGANLEAKGEEYDASKALCFKSRARCCCSSVQVCLISVLSGQTALLLSSYFGHLEVTRFLVESGANLEATSKSVPPLAVSSRCRGLKPHSLRCRDGKTALQHAIEQNKSDVAAYLRSIGAPE